jgi:butyryl-CoA dehydrogenase
MNLELSEEQLLIQKMVKEFAAAEMAPLAAEIDRDHRSLKSCSPRWQSLVSWVFPSLRNSAGLALTM